MLKEHADVAISVSNLRDGNCSNAIHRAWEFSQLNMGVVSEFVTADWSLGDLTNGIFVAHIPQLFTSAPLNLPASAGASLP